MRESVLWYPIRWLREYNARFFGDGLRMRIEGPPVDDVDPPGPNARVWLNWLQQVPSLIYLVAGAFLVGLYWQRLPRRTVLLCGVLFLLYSVYRFFLVRRNLRRSGR